jgi:hypothetical protein
MAVSSEITDILSEFGVPAGAVGLAVGLVRGAGALEKDASAPALKYVSDLLRAGGPAGVGKVGATLVPLIFDKIFGSRPLSFRFISRSIIATTCFWIVLLVVKHASLYRSVAALNDQLYLVILPIWYCLDYVSLVKSRYLLKFISDKNSWKSTLIFFLADIIISYVLSFFALLLVEYVDFAVVFKEFTAITAKQFHDLINMFVTLQPISQYFTAKPNSMLLDYVIIPSTLLTSLWTFLFLLSSVIVTLLVPVDHLRRFAVFWFRDVEKQPLTVIAKVAATLIIVGSGVTKALHWFWT